MESVQMMVIFFSKENLKSMMEGDERFSVTDKQLPPAKIQLMNIPRPIKEFLSAAQMPFSYNALKNIYIWFGLFWGLPIPVVTILLQLYHLEITGVNKPLLVTLADPIQWFFLAHPFLFAVVFGILGTIRNVKDKELSRVINELSKQSVQDALTGLKNRRYFLDTFYGECARSLRRKEDLSLLFLDIDRFKQINDTRGHHVGDIVLKELGRFLLKQCRPYDTPVRWGGEEFLVLLRGTDEEAALLFADRTRHAIEKGFTDAVSFTFTVSIGLAQYQKNDTLEQLVERADKALYRAKQTGRNRVVCWSMMDKA